MYNNAKPVFADINRGTLTIDVKDIEKKISKKTKAVILVHMGGQPCDMDSILKIAKSYNLYVVEDVAHALGGEYKNKKMGTFGEFGCFSFEAKKNMTTGDGGMIVTNNSDKVDRLKRLRWLGIDKDTWKRYGKKTKRHWYYEVPELGYKCHMNDIQAAIGLVQLKKLDEFNRKKRDIIKVYMNELKNIPWIELPEDVDLEKGCYWVFIIKVENRDDFVSYMLDNEITTGVHYMPVHLHPYYRRFKAYCPVAEEVWRKIVSLPLFPDMTEIQLEKVVNTIKKFKN